MGDGAVEAGIDLQRVELFSLALIEREPDEAYARGAHALAVSRCEPGKLWGEEDRIDSLLLLHGTRQFVCLDHAGEEVERRVVWVEQQRLDLALGERCEREHDSRAGHGALPWVADGSQRWTRGTLEQEVELCVLVRQRERGRLRGVADRDTDRDRRGARVRVGR